MKYLQAYVQRIKAMGGEAMPEALELASNINQLCLISEKIAKQLKQEIYNEANEIKSIEALAEYNTFKRQN